MDVTYGRPPGRPGRGTPTRPHRGSFGPAILTHNNSRGYVMHVYCVAIEFNLSSVNQFSSGNMSTCIIYNEINK